MGVKAKTYTDVIVVGAGLAGMVSAYAASREGARVLLLDRGSVATGTNSVLSNGMFCGPTPGYPLESYVKDTIAIGRGINHEPTVRRIARGAGQAIDLLRSMGSTVKELKEAYMVVAADPHLIPGFTLVRTVKESLRSAVNIASVTGFYATKIAKDETGVKGVKGFDREGEEISLYAPAVILATGGAGAIYLRNDNQKQIMGQGYRLAAEAGLELWDMEFVQFYPIVFAEPGLPSMLAYPPHHEEARLLNHKGEDLVRQYGFIDVNQALVRHRDAFSALLLEESRKGPVYMDFRKVPAANWEEHPMALLHGFRAILKERPVRVAPAAHFFMGGLLVNEQNETALPGLFACGEVAWGLHGANRRGGNALTECLVSGLAAGDAAARRAAANPLSRDAEKTRRNEAGPDGTFSPGDLAALRNRIRLAAWNHAGVIRTAQGIREGLALSEGLFRELSEQGAANPAQRALREDLLSAAFVLKAILTASLERKESRGAFMRGDFPEEDNISCLVNSCLSYDRKSDSFALCHRPVVPPV